MTTRSWSPTISVQYTNLTPHVPDENLSNRLLARLAEPAPPPAVPAAYAASRTSTVICFPKAASAA